MCLIFTADATVRAGKGPGGSADGFMGLVFTADATVHAGKGPGGSGDGVQNKFELLNIKDCVQKVRVTYQHAKVCTEHRNISTSVYIGTCILPEFPV